MSDVYSYRDILVKEGFQLIGELGYRLGLTIWWNRAPDRLLQVLVVNLGRSFLIKADKSYYLKSVSAEGETWARDIGPLHQYLEDHFPELRLSFSHFRDVPPKLAESEARRRLSVDAPTQTIPSLEEIVRLQRQLLARQRDAGATETLLSHSYLNADFLTAYAHQQTRSDQAEIGQLETTIEKQKQRLGLLQHLQREYQRKGSAAVYSFSISSNLQVAENPQKFGDMLRAVVRELTDQHRFQIQQKLQGGRLNIQVAETEEPAIAWIEQWLGGALSPIQMQRINPASDSVRSAGLNHAMVTPDEPITVKGHERVAEKHIAARFLSTVLQRLDKTDACGHKGKLDPDAIPVEAMPLRIGLRTDDAGRTIGPAVFPLTELLHTCVSGNTGSGKSFLARALVEEAAQHKGLNILVLDPRNQFVGLLVPEDRPPILQRYEEFGMNLGQARGFAFSYFAPSVAGASPLPQDFSSLATGRSIVSFKRMDDQQRCELAARILDATFATISASEADRPRLLIVVDEAQLLTKKRVEESAKEAAGQAERALDRFSREARKHGGVLF